MFNPFKKHKRADAAPVVPTDDEKKKKQPTTEGGDGPPPDPLNPIVPDDENEENDREETTMPDETKNKGAEAPAPNPPAPPQPTAATFTELDALCPAETPGREAFIVDCQKKGLTAGAASTALMAHLVAENKKLAKANSDHANLKGHGGGADPVTFAPGASEGGSGKYAAFTDYTALVTHIHKAEKKPMPEAVKTANAERPDLRAKYVGVKAA